MRYRQPKVIAFDDRRTWGGHLLTAVSQGDTDAVLAIIETSYLVGYHATRLCSDEISNIASQGFEPLSPLSFERRIANRVRCGDITPTFASKLLSENEVEERTRHGSVQFSSTKRGLQNGGAERLFRSWGGESLYLKHEGTDIGTQLMNMGTLCLIKARVSLHSIQYPAIYSMADHFVNGDPFDFSISEALPPRDIIALIQEGDSEFNFYRKGNNYS